MNDLKRDKLVTEYRGDKGVREGEIKDTEQGDDKKEVYLLRFML